MSRGNKKTEG